MYPSGLITDYSVITVHEELRQDKRFLVVLEFPLADRHTRSTPMENPFSETEITMTQEEEDVPLSGSPGDHNGPGPKPPAQEGAIVPSDPQAHRADETLWVDWIQHSGSMGYSVFDGWEFSDPSFVELKSPGHVEQTRKKIQDEVLRPNGNRR